MGLMSKIEGALSGVMEGTFGWLFRTRLEPVELARKLERAMSADTAVGVGADRRTFTLVRATMRAWSSTCVPSPYVSPTD